jgi:GntR family transcriptional repressor for pyruvate dehydrogenase complex
MAHGTGDGHSPQLKAQPYHLRPPRDSRPNTPRVTVPPSVALVLERLDGAADGVGSGTLQLYLRDHGISASQPTVGRILRELDHDGLTVKVSNRGRVLTEDGRRRLELLRFETTRHQWAEGLLRNVDPPSRADFLPILEALGLIEGEIARLAAERATDEQIKEMQAVVEAQRKNLENPMRGAQQGTDFHHLLGDACGNRFLQLAKRLLWDVNRALHDLWYEANIVTGTSSYPAHLRLAHAVAAHDPRAAQRAMHDHFAVFARAVEKHLQRVSTAEDIATVRPSLRPHRSDGSRKPL